MSSRRSVLALLVPFVAVGACSELGLDEPETVRGAAILLHYGDTTTVTVPTSARVGVPISITVTSFGGGCIVQGETEFTRRGLEAEVRPYRYETVRLPPNMACTDELRIFQHTVSTTFEESGDARVRVFGLRRPGDAPHVVERQVPVLP
jgi:hypothetical protein